MNYKYQNQFNMDTALSEAVTSIINSHEKERYVCKVLICEVPEHKDLIFVSPLDGYNAYGGGLNALSGAQIAAINEKYGKYVPGTVEAEDYSYLGVMLESDYQFFKELKFKSREEIYRILKSLCPVVTEYDGIFNPNIFYERFPYLQPFFTSIDTWRAETGRVTIDQKVLVKAKQENTKKKV